MTPKKVLLYIEDDDHSRIEGMAAIKARKLPRVLAPKSSDECAEMIRNKALYGAAIDYKLSNWVQVNNSKPVIINEKANFDGLGVADEISVKSSDIPIGMFSGNERHLKDQFKRRNFQGNKRNIRILPQADMPPENIYRFLPDFVEEAYKSQKKKEDKKPPAVLIKFHIKVKPLHKVEKDPSLSIKTFFYKKILASLSKGQDLWKAGNFVWMVSVNEELELIHEEEILEVENFTSGNRVEEFIMGIDDRDFYIQQIQLVSDGFAIKKDEIFKKIKNLASEISEPSLITGY